MPTRMDHESGYLYKFFPNTGPAQPHHSNPQTTMLPWWATFPSSLHSAEGKEQKKGTTRPLRQALPTNSDPTAPVPRFPLSDPSLHLGSLSLAPTRLGRGSVAGSFRPRKHGVHPWVWVSPPRCRLRSRCPGLRRSFPDRSSSPSLLG